MESINTKKVFVFLVVFGGAYLAFKFVTPKERKNLNVGAKESKELEPNERPYIEPPQMDETEESKNEKANVAFIVLDAYINAYNAGELQDGLNSLNDELAHEFGMRVYRRRSDDKLVVEDLNKQDILVYNS